MNIIDIVTKHCTQPIDQIGYELVRATYEQDFGVWELTLYIKNKNGNPITHKDCKAVTLAVDDLLETLDPTKGQPYNLSVSSVGIEHKEDKE